jgi:broad specificity phosphatase PhoE
LAGVLEIVFIRHGEGEHLLDLPRSLEMKHPRLTPRGRAQVEALRPSVEVTDDDLVLASPTPRTIETAEILCGGGFPLKYVCPAVRPRMFPQGPNINPLLCDDIFEPDVLRREFPRYQLHPVEADSELWLGINKISAARFAQAVTELLLWCKAVGRPRVIVVSHDGTIHNFREFFGETNLTRASFLGPAGLHRVNVPA